MDAPIHRHTIGQVGDVKLLGFHLYALWIEVWSVWVLIYILYAKISHLILILRADMGSCMWHEICLYCLSMVKSVHVCLKFRVIQQASLLVVILQLIQVSYRNSFLLLSV